MSSTNFGSILIFASCVVGACNILYGWAFYWEGSYFLSTIIINVGIFTLGGEFRARRNIIFIILYKFIIADAVSNTLRSIICT